MHIIGIGASAGGVEALQSFFYNTPNTTGNAYIVVQHLSPNHKTIMDEILSKKTGMTVRMVENEMVIEKDSVYLIPPGKVITVQGNRLILEDKPHNYLSFPINILFESLAEQYFDKAIAIILSGTGSDGTEGIKAIKEAGGLVVVQDPATCKFDGMPNSATATGVVDLILPPEQIYESIAQIINQPAMINETEEDQKPDALLDGYYSQILREVKIKTGVDFSGYKSSTVIRRIQRRMVICQMNSFHDYYGLLKSSINEAHYLQKEILINVTSFFRDPDAFVELRDNVIPKIANQYPGDPIRVWVPACCTGEEAYSIAILFREYMEAHKVALDVTIFATDIDTTSVKLAGSRIFSESSVSKIPSEYLTKYFIPHEDGYKITKSVRDMIIFSRHNILKDPPFFNIDLVSCRNLLIYFKPALQRKLFSIFSFTLKSNGFLFLGKSESPIDKFENFIEEDKRARIFRNRSRGRFNPSDFKMPEATPSSKDGSGGIGLQYRDHGNRLLSEQINRLLIQEYAPTTFIVRDDLELVHSTGDAHEFMKFPIGEVTYNIIKLLPKNLALAFEVGILKTLNVGKPTTLKNLAHKVGKTERKFNVYIRPFNHTDLPYKLINIELREISLKEGESEKKNGNIIIDLSDQQTEKITFLEDELRINKDHLQMTIEELESANEELQAANEELHSSNEELESVNEELYTVNSEYHNKVLELTEANDDLNNLLQSTDIATLFLDNALNIRRYTRTMNKIMDLLPHDVGRHVSNFGSKLKYPELLKDVQEVSETLIPKEKQIEDLNDNFFIVKIFPFRSVTNEIKGVVITFIDITNSRTLLAQLNASQENLAEANLKKFHAEELYKTISQNSRDLVCLHEPDGTFNYISPSVKEMLGYQGSELTGTNIVSLFHPEDAAKLFNAALVNAKDGILENTMECRIRRKNGDYLWIETVSKFITDSSGNIIKLLTSSRDISERKKAEYIILERTRLLQLSEERFRILSEFIPQMVWTAEPDGTVDFFNKKWFELTGAGKDENELISWWKKILHPGDFEVVFAEWTKAHQIGQEFMVQCRFKNMDTGDYQWFLGKAVPLKDENNNIVKWFGTFTDIDQQKKVEHKKDEFIGVASHELKTPLTSIKAYNELLERRLTESGDSLAVNYISKSNSFVKKLENLISELLDVSKIQAGKMMFNFTEFELLEFVEECVNTVKPLSNKHSIVIDGQRGLIIKADKQRLEQVFNNFLSNSIKYSPGGTEISVNVKKVHNKIVVAIKDQGIGIPKEKQQFIFDRFFRVEDNNYKFQGLGLGLFISSEIVKRHGGETWVESEPGEGSTFYFSLPFSDN